MAEFPDAPDVKQIVESAEDDSFSRRLSVAIVLVTLAAAVTAWLQAGAGRDDDEAAVRAERLASETLAVRASTQELASLRVQRERLAEERGRRAEAYALQRAFGVGSADEARILERGWKRAEEATRRTTDRIARAEGIPELEPGAAERSEFPNDFFAAAGREAERLSSLRDAANREGDRAEEQVGAYGVALATFAVSVFLFGYSLTPYGRRNRRLFAAAGGLLASAAAIWTLGNVLDPPDRPPEEAGAAYADAVVAAQQGEREAAIEAGDRAIELRPRYPDAYALRGLVRIGAFELAGEELLPEIEAGDELRAGRADLRTAVELDDADIDALVGLAAAELVLGIQEGDPDSLRRAATVASDAIERDPVLAQPRYLLAEALLGLGEDEAAARAFASAGERAATEEDGETPRIEAARRSLVGSAITIVDQLVAAGLLEEAQAEGWKGRLLTDAWPELGPPLAPISGEGDEPGQEGAPSFRRLQLNVLPWGYEIAWPADSRSQARPPRSGGPAYDATRDRLAVVFYSRDSSGDWVAVPEISGPVRGGELFYSPSQRKAVLTRDRLAVTVPPRCIPAGRYRAELFVDGALVDAVEVGDSPGSEGALLLDGLALVACPPPGWERLPRSETGVVDGIASPDGRAGLLTVRVPRLAAPGRGRAATRQALPAAIDVLDPLIPGRIESTTRTTGPFVEATNAPTRVMRTTKGGAVAAAARLAEDEIVVGAVYGPRRLFDPDPETGLSQAGAALGALDDRFTP